MENLAGGATVDVAKWLADLGLGQYGAVFSEHAIDGDILGKLDDDDLKELGIKALGHRKRLLEAIVALANGPAAGTPGVSCDPSPVLWPHRAERRQLTLLFCDLVGSTELSAQLDPEDLGDIMRAYRNVCQAYIDQWGGHVAKFLGDGVLAYFGFPEAHEDDAERAVRAGLDLARAVSKLTARDQQYLSARVGIATGLVIVGELIGDGASLEETVIGETPNLAARLETFAQPGSVVISHQTRELIGDLFELDDLGKPALKGFAGPTQIWGVIGTKVTTSRFAARMGSILTPLVGREPELSLFDDLWKQATAGHGQVMLVSGDPGIGKSRLSQALSERLAEQSFKTTICQCSPFHTNSALYPMIDHLERAAGFSSQDTTAAKLDKMEALLAEAILDDDDAPALMSALLSLPTERYPELPPSAQRQKERTLEVLVQYLESQTQRNLVPLVFEDIHWIDPTSLELLDHLVKRVAALSMVAILTYRPEFRPSWVGQAHVHAVLLNRLPKSESATMVTGVTGGKRLPEGILAQILEKTDGVPLFLEELTKTVLESGFLVDAGDHFTAQEDLPSFAIPTSLRDSLVARLDRFPYEKELAQIGAAIGREFSHTLVASLSPLSAVQLARALDNLLQAGLLFKRGIAPDATYIFKHALVQDAAYQSMLICKRQQLHARIAQTLIGGSDEVKEKQPELIAQHYSEAGMYDRAVGYWKRAGDLALRRSANAEAAAHLRRGIRDLRRSSDTSDTSDAELELQLALGAALIASKGYAAPETGQTYERAVELCEVAGDKDKLAPALYGLSLFHMDAGRLRKSVEVAETLLERASDSTAKLLAHRVAGSGTMYMGEWQKAHDHHRKALELYQPAEHRELRHLYAQDQHVCATADIACSLLMLGHVDEAISCRDQSLVEARDIGHPHSLAFALHTYVLDAWLQDVDRLKAVGNEMIALCDKHGFPFHRCGGISAIGCAQLLEGDYQGAIKNFTEGLAGYHSTNTGYLTQFVLGQMSRCHLRLGNIEESISFLEEAFKVVEQNEERSDEPALFLLKGQIALEQGRGTEIAASFIKKGLDLARRQHARWWELRLSTSLAGLLAKYSRRQEAFEILKPVYESFSSGFQTRDLIEAKQLLDSFV